VSGYLHVGIAPSPMAPEVAFARDNWALRICRRADYDLLCSCALSSQVSRRLAEVHKEPKMNLFAVNFIENVKDSIRFGFAFPFRYTKMLFSDIYTVNVRGIGPIHIRKKSSDILVLRQVFRTRQYELGHYPQTGRINKRYRQILDQGKVPLIIDAGANNGCSALWFATKFPNSKVVAIEPDHENFQMCRINTEEKSNITVIEAAIGGVPGFVTLENPTQQSWGVQTTRGGTGNKVEVRTINDIAGSFGSKYELFIVKIDIEGFEVDLFSHNTDWLESPMAIIIELHDWKFPGQFSSVPFQRAIAKYKFEIIMSNENLIYIGDFDPSIKGPQLESAAAGAL
jgi:FkbM family methyltransferase